MPFPSSRKLLSLAAALALVLAAFPLAARAQQGDVTILVPDDGSAVLYSHDAAPEAVLALDPATAPEAVSLLLSSSSMPEAAADDEIEAALAPLIADAAASAAAEEVSMTTEEEAMVEATVSMLQAALGDAEMDSSSSETANDAEVIAVAGQPAPRAVAAAPSPAVVPTGAQLVCPPTCPAGTRCRQGSRGICEPFSAFDCSNGACSPSPSVSPPSTPTSTTTPPVCQAKCTDVAPTPNWSCAQQMSFGACEQGWMTEGNFCQITCGRCPSACYDCGSMCLDKAVGGSSCAAQAGWGKCAVRVCLRLLSFCLLVGGEREGFFRERETEREKAKMILERGAREKPKEKNSSLSFRRLFSLSILSRKTKHTHKTGNLDGGMHALLRQVPREMLL